MLEKLTEYSEYACFALAFGILAVPSVLGGYVIAVQLIRYFQ